jgi:radical SAM protein with 4Fe4S-binding SPASM domain
MMDFRLYQKIIDDLRELTGRYGQKINRLHLYKDGEPLLHKQLPEMVRLAKQAEVAQSVETTTNGALLNESKSLQLIDAGLDVLRVSVEHVQNSYYAKVTNGKFTYEDIREKVRTAFSQKMASASKMHLHVKIIDVGLSEEDKARFAADFAPITDSWNVERMHRWSGIDIEVPATAGNSVVAGPDGMIRKRNRIVCPEPFAKLMINFDGSVSVCCVDWSHGTVVGNVTRETVSAIWTGKRLEEFRIRHLTGKRGTIPACASCDYIQGFPSFADLDEHREELLNRFRPTGLPDEDPH